MSSLLFRVTAPHFVAGLVVENGVVRRVAPIMGWALDKPYLTVLAWVRKKRYQIELLD